MRGIEDYRSGDDRAEEGSASDFVYAGHQPRACIPGRLLIPQCATQALQQAQLRGGGRPLGFGELGLETHGSGARSCSPRVLWKRKRDLVKRDLVKLLEAAAPCCAEQTGRSESRFSSGWGRTAKSRLLRFARRRNDKHERLSGLQWSRCAAWDGAMASIRYLAGRNSQFVICRWVLG